MVIYTYNNTSVNICTKLDDETVVAVTGTFRTEWNGKGGVESEHTVHDRESTVERDRCCHKIPLGY